MITYHHKGHTAIIQYRIVTNHVNYFPADPAVTIFSLVCAIQTGGGFAKTVMGFQNCEKWKEAVREYQHFILSGLFDRAEIKLHNSMFERIRQSVEEVIISLNTK